MGPSDDETFVEGSNSPGYSPERRQEDPTALFLRVTEDMYALLRRSFRTMQRCEALLHDLHKQKTEPRPPEEEGRRRRFYDGRQEEFISGAISQFLESWHNQYICFDFKRHGCTANEGCLRLHRSEHNSVLAREIRAAVLRPRYRNLFHEIYDECKNTRSGIVAQQMISELSTLASNFEQEFRSKKQRQEEKE